MQATLPTEAALLPAREEDATIHELCRDTSMALQELRHMIDASLRVTLTRASLDPWTLAQLLDERPSVVVDLRSGDFEELTTETMVEYLDKLRVHICPK